MALIQSTASPNKPHIELSKLGWRKLAQVNHKLGSHFIRAFIMRHEVRDYLSFHEASATSLDTQCQELHYDDCVCLLMRKVQGVWYILDIWICKAVEYFVPIFILERLKRSCSEIVFHVAVRWQSYRLFQFDSNRSI